MCTFAIVKKNCFVIVGESEMTELGWVQKSKLRILKKLGLNYIKDCLKIESQGDWGKGNIIWSEKCLLRSKLLVRIIYYFNIW